MTFRQSTVLLCALTVSFADAVASAADTKPNVSGTWSWEWTIQERTLKRMVKLQVKDKKLVGTYIGSSGTYALENPKLDGEKLAFQITREFNGQQVQIQFEGTVKGDQITGKMSAGDRNLDWKATRTIDPADLVGTWNYTIEAGDQTLTPKLKLTKKDDKLVGVYTGRSGDREIKDVTIKGTEFSFKIAGENDGNSYSVTFKGRPQGDVIKGEVDFDFGGQTGTVPFEGKREKKVSKKKTTDK